MVECHCGKKHQLNCRRSVILDRIQRPEEGDLCPLPPHHWHTVPCAAVEYEFGISNAPLARREGVIPVQQWNLAEAGGKGHAHRTCRTCLQAYRTEKSQGNLEHLGCHPHPGPLYPDACPYLSKTTWRTKTQNPKLILSNAIWAQLAVSSKGL